MPPPQHRQRRSQLNQITTMLLLVLSVPGAQGLKVTTVHAADPGIERRHEMPVGSPCAGAEGQWNCMTSSFQRCSSGQWSKIRQCAVGTQCSPSGLTYQFHVDFADADTNPGAVPPPPSTAGGANMRRGFLDFWLLSGLGLLAIVV